VTRKSGIYEGLFNNDWEGFAVRNALALRDLLAPQQGPPRR